MITTTEEINVSLSVPIFSKTKKKKTKISKKKKLQKNFVFGKSFAIILQSRFEVIPKDNCESSKL